MRRGAREAFQCLQSAFEVSTWPRPIPPSPFLPAQTTFHCFVPPGKRLAKKKKKKKGKQLVTSPARSCLAHEQVLSDSEKKKEDDEELRHKSFFEMLRNRGRESSQVRLLKPYALLNAGLVIATDKAEPQLVVSLQIIAAHHVFPRQSTALEYSDVSVQHLQSLSPSLFISLSLSPHSSGCCRGASAEPSVDDAGQPAAAAARARGRRQGRRGREHASGAATAKGRTSGWAPRGGKPRHGGAKVCTPCPCLWQALAIGSHLQSGRLSHIPSSCG